MKVFIDTGVFLSISDKSDAFNKLVSSVYKKVAEQNAVLYTSNYIIDETITLIRARVNHKAAVAFIKGFNISNIRMLRITEGDENSAKETSIIKVDIAIEFLPHHCPQDLYRHPQLFLISIFEQRI